MCFKINVKVLQSKREIIADGSADLHEWTKNAESGLYISQYVIR